ncbi:MAG: dynamin family protein [Propionibacteriaceae bacterium]|nr:dynamin family protein [Propionibacteriaceae bacterium]
MASALESALALLRAAFQAVRLDLPLPSQAQTRAKVDHALGQLDDYVMPRLRQIKAPLLVIVGGSTGAGKSTLVNSIIGHAVSPTGVIRPTTKSPVLIHHPQDTEWFVDGRVLPGLARSTAADRDVHVLRIVADPVMPRGMAVLDAPDIDSIDAQNRALASQLLAAGDLWLFITSAARYADAVPWEYLAEAVERSAAVAVVLDRIPPAAMTEVPSHLAAMMTDRGLGNSPFFAVPETIVDERGLLPGAAVEPIRAWLTALASDQRTRGLVVMKTLDGAISALAGQAPLIARGQRDQLEVAESLRQDAAAAFALSIEEVTRQIQDGVLLRDEVLTRWQDYVGTGQLTRHLESRLARWRDRVGRTVRGQPIEADDAKQAVESGLEALLGQAGERACERAEASWLAHPAGRVVIQRSGAALSQVGSGFSDQVARTIQDWQSDVLDLVSQEGSGKRIQARVAALGVNAVGVSLMLVAFSHTGGLAGAELGLAGGTAVVAQKVLEMVFGDEAIRRLAVKSKELLDARVKTLMSTQLRRFTAALESLRLDPRLPGEIVDAAEWVERLRSEELVNLSLQAVLTTTEQAAIQAVEGVRTNSLEQVINSRQTTSATVGGS